MRYSKRLLVMALAVCMLISVAVLFSSCGNTNNDENEFEGKFLVIYDGNGGYLGNKTLQVRKLYCEPNSKIPDYPQDYGQEYTVPSLGLAIRDGYTLMGWYVEGSETYKEDVFGDSVYLDTESNNGVYTYDDNGNFVYDYVVKEDGKFVWVFVEEFTASEDEGEAEIPVYVFINAERAETIESEIGFYLYKGNDLGDYASEDEHKAFTESYAEKTYSATELSKISGWQLYSELEDTYKTMYGQADRYSHEYRAYNAESDEGFDRFALESGYAILDNMFEADENGAYVYIEGKFELYDENNAEHAEAERFSITAKYVFTATEEVKSPSYLKRFIASYDYWNFSEDRVTDEIVDESGALTLYAHWSKKYTVYFHDNNGVEGAFTAMTTKLAENNISQIEYKSGMTIKKIERIPVYPDHTFVCWSKSETEYDPWDFENDVLPDGQAEIHLYAFYLEGVYTRITTKDQLAAIKNNPSGNYILAADIDLGGASFPKKNGAYPSGLDGTTAFTGKFASFGFKVTNFKAGYTGETEPNDAQAIFGKVDGAQFIGSEDFAEFTPKKQTSPVGGLG